MFEIDFKDNSALILAALQNQLDAANEEIGIRAEGYAKAKTPVGTPESTEIKGYVSSGLRKSITHKVVNNEIYIGTNKKARNADGEEVPYAIYVELGTGKYATDGKGRKSPWAWIDKNGKKHWTVGMEPNHMLRDSVADHQEEYMKIYKKYLKG